MLNWYCVAAFWVGMLIAFLISPLIWPEPKAMADPTYYPPKETLAIPGRLTLRYEIENYIKTKFGKDGERALKIAYCESRLEQNAIHENKNGSVDRGIYQLNTIHKGISNECAFNAKCNIDASYQIYLKQKFQPWVCARYI
jgi:hypothetical protein